MVVEFQQIIAQGKVRGEVERGIAAALGNDLFVGNRSQFVPHILGVLGKGVGDGTTGVGTLPSLGKVFVKHVNALRTAEEGSRVGALGTEVVGDLERSLASGGVEPNIGGVVAVNEGADVGAKGDHAIR